MFNKRASELTILLLSVVLFIVIFLNPLKESTFGDFGLMEIQVFDIIKTNFSTFAYQYPGESIDPDYQFVSFTKPFLGKVNGKYYIDFPPYFPLLNAPFVKLFGVSGFFILNYLSLIGTFILLNKIAIYFNLSSPYRNLSLFLFGFGTNIFLYNIVFHEYPTAVFLIVLSIYFLLKYLKSERKFHAALFGFFGGLSLVFRLEMIFLLIAGGIGALSYDRKRFLPFTIYSLAGFILPFAGLLYFNYTIHGHILGLRYLLTLTDNPSPDFLQRISIIREMLFSKTRGLLYQSPFVLFSILFLFIKNQIKETLFLKVFLAVSIILILLTSPNHGDHISPRYLFGTYPFLAIAGVLMFQRLTETKFQKTAIAAITITILYSFYSSYKSYKWYKDSAVNVSVINSFVQKTGAKNIILADYGYALNLQNSHYQKTFFVAQTPADQDRLIGEFIKKDISEFAILHPAIKEDSIKKRFQESLSSYQITIEANAFFSLISLKKLEK